MLNEITRERVSFWQSLTFPFGSEMSWDNTGHEEIYTWLSRYDGWTERDARRRGDRE